MAPTRSISPLSIISRSTTLLSRSFCMVSWTFAVSHGERTRRLIVPGSGQAALFTRRAIAPEGKQSRHTKNRVQSFEVVLRSLRRVYDGVAERHGRRTAGAPKALAVALSFCRLLGLGCPKQAFAKIATPRHFGDGLDEFCVLRTPGSVVSLYSFNGRINIGQSRRQQTELR
jgi:hypothetical protein